MAGIGEATAIIALAETGFSLARAINTYISDVSDAKDDILSLSSDIDSTFRNLRDLAHFIERNETTKVWSDDGAANARKCVRDSELVIVKMRKLLKKATASDTSPEVERDEIDVTKFQKAKWPILKPELECDDESYRLSNRISFSPTLLTTRKLLPPQLTDNELWMTFHVLKELGMPGQNPHPQSKEQYGGFYDQRGYSGRSLSDDEDVEDALNEVIYSNIEDLKMDFEDWAREKEEKQKKAEEETKRIRDKAVEDWKIEKMVEVERQRREVEENRQKLKLELSRHELRLAPLQIEETLNNVYPLPQTGNELALMPLGNQRQPSDADAVSVQISSSRKSRSWSVWSRSSRVGRRKNTHTNGRHRVEIPELLRDPLGAGGVAELKALYLQRVFYSQGPNIEAFNVEIPPQWLLHALVAKEEKYLQDPKVNSIWKELAQIPEDYRYAINGHAASAQQSSRYNESWVLIYVECLSLEKSSSRISRRAPKEVTGIYIVLKKESGSMQAAEDNDYDSPPISRRLRQRSPEYHSSDSEEAFYTTIPRRASSVIRTEHESLSKSRSDSYRRDHSHIAKRASGARSRSRYDDRDNDGGEEIRRHSSRTRSGSRRKDSTPSFMINADYPMEYSDMPRQMSERQSAYPAPYPDMPADNVYPRYPTPPLTSHRPRSGSYDNQRARFSDRPPSIINPTPEPPSRRSTYDSWGRPSRRSTVDSMDSMDSRSGPNNGYHHYHHHHPRHYSYPSPPPRPTRYDHGGGGKQVLSIYDRLSPPRTHLSNIQEVINEDLPRGDGDSDTATHSTFCSSSDSEFSYRLRALSEAEKGKVVIGETAKTDEEISREILARLTSGTTATATEDAEGKPERGGQGQEEGSSVPDVDTLRSPSAMGAFVVELSEEPAAQDQSAGADAETGGVATDSNKQSR
ncbi:hypothetical protein EPUS_00303 [Endocarpon pusillum Z07020]|uniref:Fungal N-terminal domain-containing protein n=1 Tax=Endocarpon pusillum (strain Z07020 / HMAS-L-300199) TaxID=1263415 RepID=U1GEH8_ENDPU|nr:uncharacterized protein EPUS_00303 [Endocarpon pusillum Z07020]ERF70116.1 hypothetical protein EPUS_00303 [Endocarpon pusillum Z07020]